MSIKHQKKECYIKALLVLQGISQTDLAKKTETSASFFSRVIRGKKGGTRKPGPGVDKIRQAVADALGMTIEELWPTKTSNKVTYR